MHPAVRRLAFWGGVAAVSVLANFGVEIAAEKYPNAGFARFVAYTHRGKGN